ncbi:MAG: ribonuclease H-like domain-containing protein [Clostridiales bacterium]|nr:ribonuclease H-like domain-containing protein [Clostridiales bacterium]
MTENILIEVRAACENFKDAILRGVELDSAKRQVTVNVVTDRTFTSEDEQKVYKVIKRHVPPYFDCKLQITKLTPDCEMVKRKIAEGICALSKPVFSTLSDGDIKVEKTENGFKYTVAVAKPFINLALDEQITAYLKSNFCGEFSGKCILSEVSLDELKVEERRDEIEFEIAARRFNIANFEYLEGDKKRDTAVYLSDLNLVTGEVVICGEITDIRERTYTTKKGQEKNYFNFTINDTTSSAYVTYFLRQRTADKIRALKVGDSIVCTGTNEAFNGNLRYTANTIDFGTIPANFVPERRTSKPVPMYYHYVFPQSYVDMEQGDFFTQKVVPECLKGQTFVVFDLETTGLNSSPTSGNMDKIIEIGAFKIVNGEITESFSTFINPEKKLSNEIVKLTGITQDMVADAPVYEEVMPDFYKFCEGSVLVGHNIVGFDFKFVDYYCSKIGYILEKRTIDTLHLAQGMLSLPNFKLNTVADAFNITFNHHRAVDDALATAKIFIELIKMKKSLPKF